jgi:hypothetical protein
MPRSRTPLVVTGGVVVIGLAALILALVGTRV